MLFPATQSQAKEGEKGRNVLLAVNGCDLWLIRGRIDLWRGWRFTEKKQSMDLRWTVLRCHILLPYSPLQCPSSNMYVGKKHVIVPYSAWCMFKPKAAPFHPFKRKRKAGDFPLKMIQNSLSFYASIKKDKSPTDKHEAHSSSAVNVPLMTPLNSHVWVL